MRNGVCRHWQVVPTSGFYVFHHPVDDRAQLVIGMITFDTEGAGEGHLRNPAPPARQPSIRCLVPSTEHAPQRGREAQGRQKGLARDRA